MVKRANDNKRLPTNRAFVVQFYQAEKDGGVSFEGRAEHLDSGRAEYFSSQESLCNVFNRLLANTKTNKSP